jgi:hypothetical protein
MHYKRQWRGGNAARPAKIPNGKSLEYALRFHGWTITDSGCWEWNGAQNRNGYGVVYHSGETLVASRAAFRVWKSEEIGELFVCHTCDNRICINPDHLRLGTNADNMRDMVQKGRSNRKPGTKTHNAKLTDEIVREMRLRRLAGEKAVALAEEYGVTAACIVQVCKRRSWKHVE